MGSDTSYISPSSDCLRSSPENGMVTLTDYGPRQQQTPTDPTNFSPFVNNHVNEARVWWQQELGPSSLQHWYILLKWCFHFILTEDFILGMFLKKQAHFYILEDWLQLNPGVLKVFDRNIFRKLKIEYLHWWVLATKQFLFIIPYIETLNQQKGGILLNLHKGKQNLIFYNKMKKF